MLIRTGIVNGFALIGMLLMVVTLIAAGGVAGTASAIGADVISRPATTLETFDGEIVNASRRTVPSVMQAP